MNKLYILTTIIWTVVFILAIIWKPRKNEKTEKYNKQTKIANTTNKYPYHQKKIMTSTEEKFFKELADLTKDKYYVFPQVHLASFIEVDKGILNRYIYFSKIIQKSIDYLIVDKETLEIKLAIELDDYTHSFWKRRLRDNFVNEILSRSNIALFRSTEHNLNKLKELI